MAANGRELIQRYDRLVGRRANYDWRWDRMAPYVAPSRVGILTGHSEGDKQTRNVYDSTMMMAAELMAMFIAGHIINPSQQWHGFQMRNFLDPDVDMDPVNEWLEECRDRTLKRCATSSFYAEGPEAMVDYVGFGTGWLLGEEAMQPIHKTLAGFRGFNFIAQKTGRFVIDEGPDGMIDTTFREFMMSARAIDLKWPDDPKPENIKKALVGDSDKQFKIIQGIYPRPKGEQATYRASGMPFASCWLDHESKTVIHESGYRRFPCAISRYHRTPGEVYGRGRGDLAFPDTWTLNTAKRMGFEDWALKIRPPILHGSDSVIGTLRLTPGRPTAVNLHGRPIRDQIMPFETGSRPEISQIKEEELRKSIRNIFYVEQILALLEVHKSEQTAFEFARKLELLFRLLGPVYGRLEWEWLYQIVAIMFETQLYEGGFSPPPPEIESSDGQVDVEFQNPIAKAQRSGDAESLLMTVQDLSPLTQLAPQMWDRLDPDELASGIMHTRGLPAKWMRSNKQVAAVREARQKQDQQDLELQRAEQAAGAAGKVAPLIKALAAQQGGGRV